jgi:hypothetical protein
MKNNNGVMVKPYLSSELSIIYSISHPTFTKWIKSIESELGKRVGAYYTVKQVEIIFKNFGVPYKIVDKIIAVSEF